MSIKSLPDKLRGEAKATDPHKADDYQYQLGYNDALLGIANDLIDALPTWTEFTGDPGTWPETEILFLFCPPYDGGNGFRVIRPDIVWQWDDYKIEEFDGCWWRPFCDLTTQRNNHETIRNTYPRQGYKRNR